MCECCHPLCIAADTRQYRLEHRHERMYEALWCLSTSKKEMDWWELTVTIWSGDLLSTFEARSEGVCDFFRIHRVYTFNISTHIIYVLILNVKKIARHYASFLGVYGCRLFCASISSATALRFCALSCSSLIESASFTISCMRLTMPSRRISPYSWLCLCHAL